MMSDSIKSDRFIMNTMTYIHQLYTYRFVHFLLCYSLSACVPTVEVNIEDSMGGSAPPQGGISYAGGMMITGGESMTTMGGMSGGQAMTGGTDTILSCNIGEKLGLCEICGPNNDRVPAMNDNDCPEVDCSLLSAHRLVSDDEGNLTCYLRDFPAKENNCQGLGACLSTPESYCIDDRPESIAASTQELGSCYVIEGCEGQTPPELILQPGAVCENGLGECDEEGECILTPSCLTLFDYDYNNSNQLCSDMLTTQNQCEFYVSSDQNPWNSDEISCNQFCSSRGGSCAQAWGDEDNDCERKDNANCSDTFNDGICRCNPAPQQ